jgi:hypothetical protein
MNRLLAALLLLLAALAAPMSACNSQWFAPAGGGGTAATGGASSIGGSAAIGGSISSIGGMTSPFATGGAVAGTGGDKSTGGATSACVEPEQPTANDAVLSDARQAKFHKLSGRHHRAAGRAPVTPEATSACYPWQFAPRTPLNQGAFGACGGFTGISMIASAPFNDLSFYSFTYGLEAYQGGTCIDNKCAIPCTSKTCAKAFNPQTGANDVGTYGSSVAQWLVNMDLLGGYTTADTTDALLAGLTRSTCMIGVDFWNSMFTPTKAGQLQMVTSSGFAGGHEMLAVWYDSVLKRVHVRTTWGPVWWCLASQVTSQTPTDGTGCGYAWIALTDLPKLHFDGDCPVIPANNNAKRAAM